jgi:two-component system NtrC family sensor kinase
MPYSLSTRGLSLKARLISNYLVILAIGGLATSVVGSWIVSSTIMRQAQRSVDHDFATARIVYEQQLQAVKLTVQLAASGTTVQRYLAAGDHQSLLAYLEGIRQHNDLDFLSLADPRGRVVLRALQIGPAMDDVSPISVVEAALSGKVAAAAQIVSGELLGREDPALAKRAYTRLVATPMARPLDKAEETSGMVLMAASPAIGPRGEIVGALYGGILLNGSSGIVDSVLDLVYKGERLSPDDIGTVTIFQNDFRISTNVRTETGERALGTRVSAEVQDAVLGRGDIWRGRAFVVKDWYISRYDPIRDYRGRMVGMLYVGLPERVYTSIRDRVILSFFGIAAVGFIFIIGITYYEIGRVTRPIGEMVAATRNIAAGRFDQKVQTEGQGEIAYLAQSFNSMLESLRQMRDDLEEWGRTLEDKVKSRTEELVAMQARVAQSERLASVGMLAAGVAHEINNPLGGILSLTALTLEDMRPDDPNLENLEEVVKQTERCRDIVRGLLEFSRQSRMTTGPIDLNIALQETLSLIARQALFFNVDVVKNLDEELPAVMGDKSQIQQVFMNIVMNAVQAMEERGTLTITTRRSARPGFAEVLISDTGHGIPPEKLRQIFDPFFTTKESGHGTGLGLSIAYGIVTRLSGTISVESKVGKGTTFTIRLPVGGSSNQPEAAEE